MDFRTIDGTNNNPSRPGVNAAGNSFDRLGDARFADGISVPMEGPNPREISNAVVGEGDARTPNPEGVSGMMYAWGQFVDHDLTRTLSDGRTGIDIPVPRGDPDLPPGSSISMTRAVTDPDSGTGTGNPATAVNAVTGWEDASMVYGSDGETAAALRLPDEHMQTSQGDNLPIQGGRFVAGDARVAENPSLTALHAVFVREHNWQVDHLREEDPGLTGDELYQQARAIVTAEIANITHGEFLPKLIGPDVLPAYDGHDPSVDPGITLEFAGAAFRFGHSMVSAETDKIDENGNVVGEVVSLADVFFQPPADFAADTGADGMVRHLASDLSQSMDARIVDELRNLLIDPPVFQDLAAINIQRGRDLGLGTLNETRAELGLEPYTDFDQITGDEATVDALREVFASVDEIDLWTGGLSEGHAPGAIVGPTFARIIADQFEALRDGDRFWFENLGFDARTLEEIRDTSLADIIERTTETAYIQDDVFAFHERHEVGTSAEHPKSPQLLVGGEDDDAIAGGPAGDALVAGRDWQEMTGRGGADRFVFVEPDQDATITDFQPGRDALVLEGAGNPGNGDVVAASTEEGHAVIRYGDHEVELLGVRPGQWNEGDFLF